MSNLRATFRIFISKDHPELIEFYKKQIENHNRSVSINPQPDAGFDVCFPETTIFPSNTINTKFIDFKIKGQMFYNDNITGYYVYPRSSISKTPLMLANSVGVIDSGYCGNIIGAFRNLNVFDNSNFEVKRFERLLQICHPLLCPFYVEMVENEDDLVKTVRGNGGFGSTGK
jgi:dUTP pyrophosphatase